MCGVIAKYSKTGQITDNDLMKAIQMLSHRGPDKQHIWIADDRHVALGHARLSLIDLFTGDQPLTNEDETLHVVVNGEFYGYQFIRSELESKGHVF